MSKAIYPGSFDPVTYGHLDIIRRSAQIVDELVVGVLINNAKSPFFSLKERVEILKEMTKDISNIRICSFDGLLVEFARKQQANVIVRGLRAVTDFEYELQMAQTNHILDEKIDTIFLTTSLEYAYLSSSIVKEVALLHGDISSFVPEYVIEKMQEKLTEIHQEQ